MKRRYYAGYNRYWTKRDFRNHFEGSDALFEYCWRNARQMYYGGYSMLILIMYYEAIAVNDEKSRFYIHR